MVLGVLLHTPVIIQLIQHAVVQGTHARFAGYGYIQNSGSSHVAQSLKTWCRISGTVFDHFIGYSLYALGLPKCSSHLGLYRV